MASPAHGSLPPAARGGKRRWLWGLLASAGVLVVAGLAVVAFHVASAPARSHPAPRTSSSVSESSAPAASQPPPAVLSPPDTVRAYYQAISAHRFHRAWRLGGRNAGGSYRSFVSGFQDTDHDSVQILSSEAGTVTARVTATHTDGSVQVFQGSYSVADGVIDHFDVHGVS